MKWTAYCHANFTPTIKTFYLVIFLNYFTHLQHAVLRLWQPYQRGETTMEVKSCLCVGRKLWRAFWRAMLQGLDAFGKRCGVLEWGVHGLVSIWALMVCVRTGIKAA